MYENLYRKDDIVNEFFIADTGQNHLDGKVGMISSCDTLNCHLVVKVCPGYCSGQVCQGKPRHDCCYRHQG